MLRIFTRAAACLGTQMRSSVLQPAMKLSVTPPSPNFARLFSGFQPIMLPAISKTPVADTQVRTVTKYSLRTGKRKSIKAAIKRFYRLNWGGWIRTKGGRHKKMWKKTASRKYRLRQHVFVNANQAFFLDKCVTRYWRRPKYYIDDIYEPYHTRDEHFATKKTKIYY